MKRPGFTLRDLFWLVLVVGLGLGWWVERNDRRHHRLRNDRISAALVKFIKLDGCSITLEDEWLSVHRPDGSQASFSLISSE